MLKRANDNYQTAHFGKWDMRFDNVSPKEMGYDISDGITGNNTGGEKVQAAHQQRMIQN